VDFEAPPFADPDVLFGGMVDNSVVPTSATYMDGAVEIQFGLDTSGISIVGSGAAAVVNSLDQNRNMRMEQVGGSETVGNFGFWYDAGTPATQDVDMDANNDLDSFFLRTPGDVPMSVNNGYVFVVEYVGGAPAFAASGEIWDIDAWVGGANEGYEQWIVTAWCTGNRIIDSQTSPVGLVHTDANSLDAEAWTFAVANDFSRTDRDGNPIVGQSVDGNGDPLPIQYITIEFTGDKSQGVGLAFDNFNATTVPEPSTYAALLGLAAMGFVAYRRRK
jgi:hypothetical protein